MNDDLIYRKDAIRETWREPTYSDPVNVLTEMRDRLEALPSAEPKRNEGKWIVDEKRFGDTDRHCSLCGAILEGDDWKWRNNYYCYHCGVRMKRSEYESD